MDANTPAASASPVVICVAPNGARRTHADHPALPMTPAELAREMLACVEAGVSAVHLHVREVDGRHSLSAEHYRRAIDAVRAEVGERLLIQVTTEAAGVYQPAQQMQVVRELRPAAASVSHAELIPNPQAESEAARFFEWAHNNGVALQYILYSAEQLERLLEYVQRGVVPQAAPNALFVLGRYTKNQQSDSMNLLPFLAKWPREWPWSICAFGQAESQCVAAAIALGGHVRIGFENNLHLPDGSLAANNAALVANAVVLAKAAGRVPASVAQAKQIYGVTQ